MPGKPRRKWGLPVLAPRRPSVAGRCWRAGGHGRAGRDARACPGRPARRVTATSAVLSASMRSPGDKGVPLSRRCRGRHLTWHATSSSILTATSSAGRGLTDRQRQLAIVAALAALGYTQPELKVHIHGALNVGITEQEVVETMILMSVYAGFPASLHGLRGRAAGSSTRGAAEQ